MKETGTAILDGVGFPEKSASKQARYTAHISSSTSTSYRIFTDQGRGSDIGR